MPNFKIKMPSGACLIIERLFENGFRADIVGGCVRDALLDRRADDFDVTTNAKPEEMKKIFSDMRVIETGIRHGTLTVIADGAPYEVTTYRIDGEYKDNRHPESVEFASSIEDDLSRRDFTVNAMAYSDTYGLTDLFSGKEDLKRRLIRAVGVPKDRFCEDALRILRAMRFSSVLSFEIEKNTKEAVHECAHLLRGISAERILVELYKLLGGEGAYEVISEFQDVIETVIPELKGFSLPNRERFLAVGAEARFLSIFALTHKESSKDFFRLASERLKTTRRMKEDGALTLEYASFSIESPVDALRLLRRVGGAVATLLSEVRFALGANVDERRMLKEAMSSKVPYKVSDLDVGGKEMSSLGFVGAEIGQALSALLDAVIEKGVKNEKDALLAYASTHIKQL